MLGRGQSQPSGEGKIIKAFEEIRAGRYEEALVYLKEHLALDPDDFWGWYLSCVAWGYQGNRDELFSSLEKVRALNPGSLFPGYLEAYIALLEGDLQKALLEWTRQVDYEEGWLARDLVEQARKGKDLISLARQGLEPFIILPDIMEELRLHAPHELDGETQPGSYEPSLKKNASKSPVSGRFALKLSIGAGALVAAVITGVYLSGVWNWPTKEREPWRDYTIDSSAQLGPKSSLGTSERYQFENKDQLISDFEQAKKHLGKGRINQARFLLQRIFHSNAGFKTREKTRIFLTFIPEPSHEDFSDPVFPGELIKTPLYYTDSIVLWQGTVVKLEEKEGGRRVKLIVFEKEKEYLIEAFLPEEGRSNWQPYEEFEQKQKELKNQKMQAVVFGKFKGLIGPQKIIYLELLKIWM